MDGIEFARIIEMELANRGIKKGDFYNDTGISATAMYGWKRGSTPSMESVTAVENYLGVKFSDVSKIETTGMDANLAELLDSIRSRPVQSFTSALRGKPYGLGALLALQGLRRSEILYLKAEDIDTERGLIHVHGSTVIGENNKPVDKEYNKTSASTRTVHIVIPRITELVKNMGGRLVTTNPTTLYGSINKLCEKVGIPTVGVHGLRHSYCSLARHLGWDELTVMREGGWDDPTVVHQIYTHLAEQDANADVQKMKDFFATSNATENATA